MKVSVSTRFPAAPGRRWRSVVITLSMDLAMKYNCRATLRAAVLQVAKHFGWDKKRTRVAGYPTRRGYFGYIRVYEGDSPTAEDLALLKKVERYAKHVAHRMKMETFSPEDMRLFYQPPRGFGYVDYPM